jgi:hypothetical protein
VHNKNKRLSTSIKGKKEIIHQQYIFTVQGSTGHIPKEVLALT